MGRQPKAAKIRSLLPVAGSSRPLRLLEIGVGSGAIASYFGNLETPSFDVDAVDVVDQRQVRVGYRFRLVEGVDLPYGDGVFDVVISNHVIEHVGGLAQQERHLQEIARVLAPTGAAYLASPNRWQIIEPHFGVPFLSWLPAKVRSRYLSLWAGKRLIYDCEPLNLGSIEQLIARAGLEFQNICIPALRSLIAHEGGASAFARLAGWLPEALLWRMRGACPTHVYLLRHGAVS
jgi:SAM-dependent methyltransferase